MREIDTIDELESLHHMDYDDLLEHIIAGDHELLHLDTLLRETYQQEESEE